MVSAIKSVPTPYSVMDLGIAPKACLLSDFLPAVSVVQVAPVIALQEERVKQALINIELLKRVEEAASFGGSLTFLENEKLDQSVLPVPSQAVAEKGVDRLNYSLMKFLCKVDSEYLPQIPKWILGKIRREYILLNSYKLPLKKDMFSRFIIKIIHESESKLSPDFFHKYVAQHYQIWNPDIENFEDDLRHILATVDSCYKIDKQWLADQLDSEQVLYLYISNKAKVLGLNEEHLLNALQKFTKDSELQVLYPQMLLKVAVKELDINEQLRKIQKIGMLRNEFLHLYVAKNYTDPTVKDIIPQILSAIESTYQVDKQAIVKELNLVQLRNIKDKNFAAVIGLSEKVTIHHLTPFAAQTWQGNK